MPRTSIRALIVLIATVASLAGVGSVAARIPGSDGRILYSRADPSAGAPRVYTINPDGTAPRLVVDRALDIPRWSPDGTRISGLGDGAAAIIVEVRTGAERDLAMPDPTLFTACPVWSAGGDRLFCEGLSDDDSSRAGIYSIRSSDGADLRRITANPGGDDFPGDVSPDGRWLLLVSADADGNVGTFIVGTDGIGLRRLVPSTLFVNFEAPGSWSPAGDEVVFEARTSTDHRFSIWTIRADGTGLQELIGTPRCGGPAADSASIACHTPVWSPDGRQLVFGRSDFPATSRPHIDVDVANADGTGVRRLTRSGLAQFGPDWGARPID